MKTNLEALKAVYVKNGGSLTDTYEDIAGGAPVSAYKTLKDAIAALSKLTLGGGSGLPDVTVADNGKMLKVEDGEWEAKQYPVETVDNVYYDDTVTLTSGNFAPLTLEGDYDLDNFADYTVEVDGHEATYITSPQAGFVYPYNSMTPIAIAIESDAVFATTFGYGSGEEHTIKISYSQENIDANFKYGVLKALGENVVFDGEVTNSPKNISVPFGCALILDVEMDGLKPTSFESVYYSSAVETSYLAGRHEIEILQGPGGATILYEGLDESCHAKITLKIEKNIFVNAEYDDVTNKMVTSVTIDDILTAFRNGYSLTMKASGECDGEYGESYAPINAASYDGAFSFEGVNKFANDIVTWAVDASDHSISGTLGGSNQ